VSVELVLHDARLHARPALLAVHLQHLVHVARAIQHEGVVDGLSGQRGAAAAREQGHAVRARDLEGRLHVVGDTGGCVEKSGGEPVSNRTSPRIVLRSADSRSFEITSPSYPGYYSPR